MDGNILRNFFVNFMWFLRQFIKNLWVFLRLLFNYFRRKFLTKKIRQFLCTFESSLLRPKPYKFTLLILLVVPSGIPLMFLKMLQTFGNFLTFPFFCNSFEKKYLFGNFIQQAISLERLSNIFIWITLWEIPLKFISSINLGFVQKNSLVILSVFSIFSSNFFKKS